MKNTLLFSVLIVTAAAAGLFLRLPSLHYRPLHTDEAVHAAKLGDLVEHNDYKYDPFEFHGPTLNYFTLIPAAISGQKSYVELDEFTLRIVPVFFGMVLVLLPLVMTSGLGRMSVFIAALLTSVSPAMVYYSRYYIQEILLVCFTFAVIACVYRYLQYRKVRWLLAAGISYGLMGATKETFVIPCSCAFFAAAAVWYLYSEKQSRSSTLRKYIRFWPVAVFAVSAAVVWVVFFSSFFTNPRGISDSFLTFTTYLGRAHGEGRHHHPWYYYIQLITFWKYTNGPVFTEALIVFLSVLGGVFAFSKRNFIGVSKPLVRFFTIYTLLMTAAYSVISYKTPWCMLGFFSGMIVLAGYAGACLISLAKNAGLKGLVCTLLVAGSLHLAAMSYLSGTKYAASPANPYVYSHTSMDIFDISQGIIDTVNNPAAPKKTVVQIVADGGSYWPLPWYLRSLDQDHIGYWNGFDEKIPPSPLVLVIGTNHDGRIDELHGRIINHFYDVSLPGHKNLYVSLFSGYKKLRPGVEARLLLPLDLKEKIIEQPEINMLKNNQKQLP